MLEAAERRAAFDADVQAAIDDGMRGVVAEVMRKHFPGVPPKRYPLIISSKPVVVDDYRRMSHDERTAWIEMHADVLETSLSIMKIANRIRRKEQRQRRKAAAAMRRRRGY